MKKLYLLQIPILILFFAGLFISCDFLLPAPMGRNNPFDDEAQIGRFNGAVSGSDSILTIWDWRDPVSGIDDSRIIDKIRIVHKENNPPDTKYPINPDNVTEIDSNVTWKYVWNGLKADKEHFFAFYAHEKGGIWLAPKTISLHLDFSGYLDNPTSIWSDYLYVDTSLSLNTVGTAAVPILEGPPKVIGFLYIGGLDDNSYGAILDAQIQGFNVTTQGPIDIVPVRKRVESGMVWSEISDSILYDYGHSMNVTILDNLHQIQIRDVLNFARLYGSNTIAFIPTTASAVNIDLGGASFWDGPDFRFSIWKEN